MEEDTDHRPEDLLQIPGRQYHIHKSDLESGMSPVEVSLFNDILSILEIPTEKISKEKYLLCCEEINKIMTELLNLDFSQNED
jgi:hypothetical protein